LIRQARSETEWIGTLCCLGQCEKATANKLSSVRFLAEGRRSAEAAFDAHLVKPVNAIALRKWLVDLGARKHDVTRQNTL
jgi:hypothetical protein